MENIGDKIRNLRKLRGLTQIELAEKVGRNPHTIKDYEKGRATPSIKALSLLADALGVSESQLVNGELPDIETKNKGLISAQEMSEMMAKISSFGEMELDILRDTINALSKPLPAKAQKKKEA